MDRPILDVEPRSLLYANRLDLIVKHRFFRSIVKGCDPEAEDLYRRHIEARTGGREKNPSGQSKQSVDAYIDAARSLLASMLDAGFRLDRPVVLGSNGRPRDGAHRIACALALGLNVAAIRDDKPGLGWGYEEVAGTWSFDEKIDLLRNWVRYSPHSALLCYWACAEQHWDEMSLEPDLSQVAHVDLEFDQHDQFGGLVHDLYPTTSRHVIVDKVRWLSNWRPALRVVIGTTTTADRFRAAIHAKKRLRALVPFEPKERFNALHCAANVRELVAQADVLLSSTGIRHARRREHTLPRKSIITRLMTLRSEMEARGVNPASVCVVSGMAMAAAGLRDADDIDMIGNGVERLVGTDLKVSKVRKGNYHPQIPDRVLIDNPEYHYWKFGVKILSLDVILDLKKGWTNEKAQRDVALIRDAMGSLDDSVPA